MFSVKRIVCALLVFLIPAALFFSCGAEPAKPPESSTENARSEPPREIAVPFEVGFYVNTHGGWGDGARVIRGKQELDAYYANDADPNRELYWPYLLPYDDAWFASSALVLLRRTEPSGSISHVVEGVGREGGGLLLRVARYSPEMQDTAMAHWIIAVEVARQDLEGVTSAEAAYSEQQVRDVSPTMPIAPKPTSPPPEPRPEIPYTFYAMEDTHGAGATEDQAVLLRSRAELDAFYERDSDPNKQSYGQHLPRFSEAWFRNNALLLVSKAEPDASVQLRLERVLLESGRIDVEISRIVSPPPTEIAARWILLIELAKADAASPTAARAVYTDIVVA